MLTFGLVVEGDYDEAVLTEFIRKCVGYDIEIVSRVCNLKGSLMKRFPGFLEEFRYVKQGMPVDRALVVRDADMREPQGLLREMESKIAHRTYEFAPVRFVAIVRELEAWLLADSEAIATVTREYSGRVVPMVNESIEDLVDPKARLQKMLSEAKVAYTREVVRKIAAAANLESIAYRCPSFRSFVHTVCNG
jgi:hypothetical protein